MANTVPIELVLQNFGSHKNTRIPLGLPLERCFITGSSGSGKSHVLDAMQYVLGRKILNENDFFHFEERMVDGVKDKVYEDVALVEMTILNQGPEYIHKYPKDEEIKICFKAFRGNNRKNKRFIKLPDNTEQQITLEELKQFGDWEDPLVFIDDQQTFVWTKKSARERYEDVAKFMGISSYRDSVHDARDEFNRAHENFAKAEIDLDMARLKFESISEKYHRYEEKLSIMQDIELLQNEVAHAEIFDYHDKYKQSR